MEFLNIGGGELLVIVLLAIILFGPEDIVRMMRTIGEYTRKIQQMWSQVSSGLKGEFITDELLPEEVKETIQETKESVTEVSKTLAEVKAVAETNVGETRAAVEEVTETLADVKTTVEASVKEIPQALTISADGATGNAAPPLAPNAQTAEVAGKPQDPLPANAVPDSSPFDPRELEILTTDRDMGYGDRS